ncbi:helix-turn-helix domain-containing protein [Bacillus sp. B1-b2]|uniref:helix-turn-helix domain-containing protein n=1 Tax=Bacillus sp. B1-b2 TaxID=2653201 RepID=UPI001261AECD|nr:helix-turn-helix domain-containing protein [Bacillus sp. B1-b2]KAB7671266.1 helix-turn-helix domain-containing protein [Bacillus sp. B1-b2]
MECKLKLGELEFICKQIYEFSNIPIYLLDSEKNLLLEFSPYTIHNPLYSSTQEFLRAISTTNVIRKLPIIHQTEWLENIVLIPIVKNHVIFGYLFIGPTVFPQVTKSTLNEIMERQGLKEKEELLINYLQSLKVISNWKLINVSMLLYYELYKRMLSFTEISITNLDNSVLTEETLELSLLESRQNAVFHQDPNYEREIYQYITDGKYEDLLLYWKNFHESEEFKFGLLSKKGELRNQKNLKIASITLATRAAINGGLNPEVAYTLGDTYIQELEELQNAKDVVVFTEHVVYDFAKRVDKTRKLKYTKPVAESQYYIYKHIYEELNLSRIAEYVQMNPKYLSNLFKKETGITITNYIQKLKIDESKKLLDFTNFPLSKIQALLNFTDQSYFTKIFKKHTGLTPKQYKNGSRMKL